MDLIIHLPTGNLLASRTSKSPLASLAVTQRNNLTARIWFVADGPNVTQPLIPASLPAPYTGIVVSARPNDDLDDPTLLFFADSWSPAGTGDELHYTAALNTYTAAAAALFTSPDRRRHPCYIDVDLVAADPAAGRLTVVRQREAFLYRALWQGTEGIDPDSVPAYPAPGSILTTQALATQAEAEAGNDNTKWMTPLRTAQAIAALGGTGGSGGSYLLRDASFTAEAGRNYAVDTSPTQTVPAVFPSADNYGIRFFGTEVGQTTYITVQYNEEAEDGSISLYDGDADFLQLQFGPSTNQQTLVDWINQALPLALDYTENGGKLITAALIEGEGLGYLDEWSGSPDVELPGGGEPASEIPAPFFVTLPASPAAGDVIALADARGTWGTNPVVVERNGQKIEGVETDFTNNAAGAFFSLLFIDSNIGWRVLASDTKPLNLTAPTITGAHRRTCSTGTWTGSPASFAYQWQRSDDGETGWTNIGGATANNYLPTAEDDEAKYLRCGVIATNANGPSATVYAAPVGPVEIPNFPYEGLLAFWKLDDLTDASGNGNTLTNNNGVTFNTGKVGDAAEFDSSNYLSRGASSDWILGSVEGTVNLWMRRSGTQAAEVAGNRIGATYCPWALCLDSDNSLRLLSRSAGGWAVSAGGAYGSLTIPDATWVMVTIRKDSSGVTVLVNGAADPDMTNVPAPTDTDPAPLYLGKGGDGGFMGKLDAVGFWNRALTTEEITQLYNAGNGLEP